MIGVSAGTIALVAGTTQLSTIAELFTHSPVGLRVSHSLPVRAGCLRRHRAAAARDRAGTLQGLLAG